MSSSRLAALARGERKGDLKCPFCFGRLSLEEAWRCPGCETPHHADCARENGRCTVLGCEMGLAGATGPRAYGHSRFLRSIVLALGLLAVFVFAAKFSSLNGESLVDPIAVGLFFVGITVWGTVYDHTSRRVAQNPEGV